MSSKCAEGRGGAWGYPALFLPSGAELPPCSDLDSLERLIPWLVYLTNLCWGKIVKIWSVPWLRLGCVRANWWRQMLWMQETDWEESSTPRLSFLFISLPLFLWLSFMNGRIYLILSRMGGMFLVCAFLLVAVTIIMIENVYWAPVKALSMISFVIKTVFYRWGSCGLLQWLVP